MVTTPADIKAMYLAFIEGPRQRRRRRGWGGVGGGSRTPTPTPLAREVSSGVRVMEMLRASTLIMDEVDMVLHPEERDELSRGGEGGATPDPLRWLLPMHLIGGLFRRSRRPLGWGSTRSASILRRVAAVLRSGLEGVPPGSPHLILLDTEWYSRT